MEEEDGEYTSDERENGRGSSQTERQGSLCSGERHFTPQRKELSRVEGEGVFQKARKHASSMNQSFNVS